MQIRVTAVNFSDRNSTSTAHDLLSFHFCKFFICSFFSGITPPLRQLPIWQSRMQNKLKVVFRPASPYQFPWERYYFISIRRWCERS